MAVTGTLTVGEVIDAALEDLEAKPISFAASAEQVDHGRKALYRLMKAWQNIEGTPDFLRASQTVTATTNAAHTLNPVRPLRILNANVKQSGIETPMLSLSRDQYDKLPDKSVTGLPTQFHYDRQAESAAFYVWPVFAAVSGETFEITHEREFEDVTDTSSVIDVPGEWWDPVVLGLAARLTHAYGATARKAVLLGPKELPGSASEALSQALGAASAGEVVRFG